MTTKIIWTAPDGRELTTDHIDLLITYLTTHAGDMTTAPIEEPTPKPVEPKPDPEVSMEPANPVSTTFTADTVSLARKGFIAKFDRPPKDCDPNPDGTWTCYDMKVGSNATNDVTPKPVDPKTPTTPTTPTTHGVVIPGTANIQPSSGRIYSAAGKRTGHTSYQSAHHERLSICKNSKGKWVQRWAYYSDKQRMTIVERDFPNGKWGTPKDVHNVVSEGGKGDPNWKYGYEGGYPVMSVDNHNNVSMASTSSGRAIVCGNHHAVRVKIAVADTDDINGSWTSFDYNDFPKDPNNSTVNHQRITYPALINYRGNVILSVRGQTSGGGKANGRWYWTFYQFIENTNKWEHLSTIALARGARTYLSNPAITFMPDGTERISICGTFRNEVEGGGDAHYDLIHWYSDDGKNWKHFNLNDGGSTTAKHPTSFNIRNNKSDAPVKIWDTTGRRDEKPASFVAGFGGNNLPYVYVRSRGRMNGGNRHILTHGKDGWETMTQEGAFSKDPDTARCFALPNGDTGIVWACGSDIRFMNLNPKAGANYSQGRVLAKNVVTGNYTIIIDEVAKHHGWLSIQAFKTGGRTQPAYTISIPLSEVETYQA